MVKHNNKRWKVKTVEGRAKGKGNDYQEDDVNGERLCSYFVAFFLWPFHWQGCSSQLKAVKMLILQKIFDLTFFFINVFDLAFAHDFVFTQATFLKK